MKDSGLCLIPHQKLSADCFINYAHFQNHFAFAQTGNLTQERRNLHYKRYKTVHITESCRIKTRKLLKKTKNNVRRESCGSMFFDHSSEFFHLFVQIDEKFSS